MRIATSLLLLVASVVVPWWVVFLLVIANLLLFNWFFEGVLILWMIDVVFGTVMFSWLTVAGLVGLLVVEGITYYSFYR